MIYFKNNDMIQSSQRDREINHRKRDKRDMKKMKEISRISRRKLNNMNLSEIEYIENLINKKLSDKEINDLLDYHFYKIEENHYIELIMMKNDKYRIKEIIESEYYDEEEEIEEEIKKEDENEEIEERENKIMIKREMMINYLKNLKERISYIENIDYRDYKNLIYIHIDFEESEIIFYISIDDDYISIMNYDMIEILKISNDLENMNIIKLFIEKNLIEFNYENY